MQKVTLREIRKYKSHYLLFLPIFIYFLLFAYAPFFQGLILSFQENRLIGAKPFAGFSNYFGVVKDADFIASIPNSLIIGFWDMGLYFLGSLFLALAVNEISCKRISKSIQTIAYLPYLFSWAVIGGVWALVFDIKGMANQFLKFLNVSPIFFLADPGLARPLIIGMGVWRSIGYFALLYAVAIIDIDQQLFEAAKIDGASRFIQIKSIILPALWPTMKTIIVLLGLGVFTHFDEIYVMVNSANRSRISTVLLYVYETGIINFKAGTASAGAMLVMIGTLFLSGVVRKITAYDKD